MKYKTAFFMAWGNFLALPCPKQKWEEGQRGLMLVFLPVIGLIIGAIWYFIGTLLAASLIPTEIKAAVMTVYPFIITGFIHLDGYMDCSDAILSRRPMEEKRKILKDSHVGAFAVISAIMLFLLAYASMCAEMQTEGLFIPKQGDLIILILAPAVSRGFSARAILTYKPIEQSQYKTLEKNKKYAGILLIICVAVQIIPLIFILEANYMILGTDKWLLFQSVFATLCIVNLVHALALQLGREQLGGMNGDISGFAITISELAAVIMIGII